MPGDSWAAHGEPDRPGSAVTDLHERWQFGCHSSLPLNRRAFPEAVRYRTSMPQTQQGLLSIPRTQVRGLPLGVISDPHVNALAEPQVMLNIRL